MCQSKIVPKPVSHNILLVRVHGQMTIGKRNYPTKKDKSKGKKFIFMHVAIYADKYFKKRISILMVA